MIGMYIYIHDTVQDHQRKALLVQHNYLLFHKNQTDPLDQISTNTHSVSQWNY